AALAKTFLCRVGDAASWIGAKVGRALRLQGSPFSRQQVTAIRAGTRTRQELGLARRALGRRRRRGAEVVGWWGSERSNTTSASHHLATHSGLSRRHFCFCCRPQPVRPCDRRGADGKELLAKRAADRFTDRIIGNLK